MNRIIAPAGVVSNPDHAMPRCVLLPAVQDFDKRTRSQHLGLGDVCKVCEMYPSTQNYNLVPAETSLTLLVVIADCNHISKCIATVSNRAANDALLAVSLD